MKQPQIKAKKLEIDFDSLGSEDTMEDAEAKPQPKPKVKPVLQPRFEEDRDLNKFKKMKSISSTDYM